MKNEPTFLEWLLSHLMYAIVLLMLRTALTVHTVIFEMFNVNRLTTAKSTQQMPQVYWPIQKTRESIELTLPIQSKKSVLLNCSKLFV